MSEYCLRWNNHRPNLVTVFSELLTSEALVDVTLATDGHYIHAHKLVLSACSVYFKDLFGANPCKHPIVILKDIRIDDLKTVIDFIYRGEVNVAQDRLQDVLKTAESLRIKGLAENPRSSYDELSSHGARFSASSLGSQVTRQRSSLTDSREQSLSLEGEDETEPGTPPSSKRRKITPSFDSSESQHDENDDDGKAQPCEVKDEPVDDRDNERSQSRETEQESNVGTSQENTEESVGAQGTSSELALTTSHSQGAVGVVDLLSPQPPTSQLLCMFPNQPYPKLLAQDGSTITIRHGTPENFLRAVDAVRDGRMGFCKAGRVFGVSHGTVQKYYKAMGYIVRNKTNNPNFRKRHDDVKKESPRAIQPAPQAEKSITADRDKSQLPDNSLFYPHVILDTSQNAEVESDPLVIPPYMKKPPSKRKSQEKQGWLMPPPYSPKEKMPVDSYINDHSDSMHEPDIETNPLEIKGGEKEEIAVLDSPSKDPEDIEVSNDRNTRNESIKMEEPALGIDSICID